MAPSKRVKPRNMPNYKLVKSRSCHSPPALSAQDALILLGIILVAAISLLGAVSSPESFDIIVDNVANQDLARMAALAERRATDKLLDMLESQDDDQPLWYDTADEPPPPPPPFWFNSRPLDVDEEGLPVERPLEIVPSMARALEWSKQRDIDWEASGEPVEMDLGIPSNLPPVIGLGLIFDAPLTHPVSTATISMDVPPAFMGTSPDHGDVNYGHHGYDIDSHDASDSFDGSSDDDDSNYHYSDNNDTTDSSDSDNDNDVSPAFLGLGLNLGATFNAALSTLGSYLGDTFVAHPANAGPGLDTDDDETANWSSDHDIHVHVHHEPELDELEWMSHLDMSAFAPPLRYDVRPSQVDSIDYEGAYNDVVLAPPAAPRPRAQLELPDVDDFLPYPFRG